MLSSAVSKRFGEYPNMVSDKLDAFQRNRRVQEEGDKEIMEGNFEQHFKQSIMDTRAAVIVADYIKEHLDKSDPVPYFEVYIVWKCKTLQNWKYLFSSTLHDGMYYEVTYNGDKDEWYLDAYKKFENRCIKF